VQNKLQQLDLQPRDADDIFKEHYNSSEASQQDMVSQCVLVHVKCNACGLLSWLVPSTCNPTELQIVQLSALLYCLIRMLVCYLLGYTLVGQYVSSACCTIIKKCMPNSFDSLTSPMNFITRLFP
jgi:hypothetical protein